MGLAGPAPESRTATIEKGTDLADRALFLLRLASMSYCCSEIVVKTVDRVKTAVSLRCRAWTCPDCAPQRKNQLIAEAIGGQPNTFLTLTSRRVHNKTPDQAAKQLSHAWRLIRLRYMRYKPELDKWRAQCRDAKANGRALPTKPKLPTKNGKLVLRKLPFAAVIEATKLGWPHLHILLRSVWIDQAWLSAQMAELHDSPHVWIERIDRKSIIAGYVAKYAGKCAHKFGTAKRYWKSQDYELRPPQKERFKASAGEGWERWQMTIGRWIADLRTCGFVTERLSMHKATAAPP